MEKSIYRSGRTNLACTIFVPFNCGNNCPFCTSKSMYDGFELTDTEINKICDNISKANNNPEIMEFVITGGEPFANIAMLDKFIKLMDKPVYINTSLPKMYNPSYCIDYINANKKICGVNISRHMGYTHTKDTADLLDINKIKKPVRINTIVPQNLDIDQFDTFVKTYANKNILINLRADYRKVTADTLKNVDDIKHMLLEKYAFLGSTGCLVCNTDIFETDEGLRINYHRGLEHSSVSYGNYTYINDVIIDIHGNVYSDWDMNEPSDGFIEWFLSKSTKTNTSSKKDKTKKTEHSMGISKGSYKKRNSRNCDCLSRTEIYSGCGGGCGSCHVSRATNGCGTLIYSGCGGGC